MCSVLTARRRTRVLKRGEELLESGAEVLVPGREAELLSEVPGVLVDREAGGQRCDLEQDVPRLAEVHRAKVVAVEDLGDVPAGLTGDRLPGEVLLVLAGPYDVVHSARTRALAVIIVMW